MSRLPASSSDSSSPRYTAPALEKGLDILELLADSNTGLTQSEIAKELGRSVSEIFRMLVVLEARGYIAANMATDRNVLTTKLFEIANRTSLIRRLSSVADPAMRDLAKTINQSVHLGVIADGTVLIIAQVDSPARHILSVRLGTRADLWLSSSGRVIMAFHTEEEIMEMLNRIAPPKGVSTQKLLKELTLVRKRGYEVVDSLVIRGVVNIAAPVIDYTGQAIAALTVPYIERYDEVTNFNECCQLILKVAARLSHTLGGGLKNDQKTST